MKSYKDKPCRACGDIFPQRKSTEVVCSVKCAIELSKKKTDHKKKLADKVEIEVLKLKVKTISDYTKEAQAVFNKWIRVRDINEPCISCGSYMGQMHCGHYKTTKAHPELRFNELNCHKQCATCNNYLSGNIIKYRIELINRIGIEKVEWIEGPHSPVKYTIEDLKEIKKKYAVK